MKVSHMTSRLCPFRMGSDLADANCQGDACSAFSVPRPEETRNHLRVDQVPDKGDNLYNWIWTPYPINPGIERPPIDQQVGTWSRPLQDPDAMCNMWPYVEVNS